METSLWARLRVLEEDGFLDVDSGLPRKAMEEVIKYMELRLLIPKPSKPRSIEDRIADLEKLVHGHSSKT